jgi:hypothetical protein
MRSKARGSKAARLALGLILGALACMPVQRPYTFAVPRGRGVGAEEIARMMTEVGLRPAGTQCDSKIVYSKWEDTGQRDSPLGYDDDVATQVFRRYALRVDREGAAIAVRVERQRCRLYAAVVTGVAPGGDPSRCVPEQVPGTCQPLHSDRLDEAAQRSLDALGRRIELAMARGVSPPAASTP